MKTLNVAMKVTVFFPQASAEPSPNVRDIREQIRFTKWIADHTDSAALWQSFDRKIRQLSGVVD